MGVLVCAALVCGWLLSGWYSLRWDAHQYRSQDPSYLGIVLSNGGLSVFHGRVHFDASSQLDVDSKRFFEPRSTMVKSWIEQGYAGMVTAIDPHHRQVR